MSDFLKLFFGLGIVAGLIVLGALYFEKFLTEEEIIIEIEKVEQIYKDEQLYYLVYSKDEIFENRNSFFHQKDNAEYLNGEFRKGRKLKVRVVGYKFGVKLPFLMEYRNIIDIITKDDLIKDKIRY